MTTRVPHHPATFSLLTLSVALGVLASVIYVPSIPAIALALGVGEGAVQHSMTLYLLAFAVSTLLIGPISDRLGRRPTLIGGLVLFSLSGVACALSDTILTLQLARMVQGVGACACMIVGRAVVRDIYDRERTARAMAILGIVVASGPALAPLLGGQLQVLFGWESSFVFVAGWGALLLLMAIWVLPETVDRRQVAPGVVRQFAHSYSLLLTAPPFIGYALSVGGGAVGFYAFTAAAPIVLISVHGVPAELYGFFAACPPIGFVTGSWVCSRLTSRFGIERMILAGCIGILLTGTAIVGLDLGVGGPYAIALPMIAFGFSNGLSMPNAFAGGLSVYPRIAGAASGLQTFCQMGGGALGTLLVAEFAVRTGWELGVMIIAGGLAALAGGLMVLLPWAPPSGAAGQGDGQAARPD
ncbi:multidrug effflux MFS transporter [Marinibaculum pumilum]|uniref:Bcr/CflA family efflux transporter n=1 Tax=Marinibaculum pumilum TaxID=1766165 RepID=A0ABV7L4V8_9PROT